MKLIIKSISKNNNTFYSYVSGRKVGFYLTNRLSKIFFDGLKVGMYIDFEVSSKQKRIENKLHYQVLHFNTISNLNHNRSFYDHAKLKESMIDFLTSKEHFLFLDLEMTIPYHRQSKFIPEIVQYGLYLTNKEGIVLEEAGNYILTSLQSPLSKRTLKFLSIDTNEYYATARPYNEFYDLLSNIMTKYQPKIVVWGKNDIIAIDHSYSIYNKLELTNRTDFIDLLKLHKDYFNLKNDLGLFKAYETYYNKSVIQVHDAKDDAKVTKKVFEAFLNYSSNELNNK